MEYVVIKNFTDKDDKRKYKIGDRYPYRGFGRKERIEELSTKRNMRGEVLIRPLGHQPEEIDKHTDEENERVRRRKSDIGDQNLND